jgi:hypothetical protein
MYPAAMFNSAGKNSPEMKEITVTAAGDLVVTEVVIHVPVGHDRINRS